VDPRPLCPSALEVGRIVPRVDQERVILNR
jgi:hypothetical protein